MKLKFYLHNDNDVIIITLLIEVSVIQMWIVCFNNVYQHQLNYINKSEIILMNIHIYRDVCHIFCLNFSCYTLIWGIVLYYSFYVVWCNFSFYFTLHVLHIFNVRKLSRLIPNSNDNLINLVHWHNRNAKSFRIHRRNSPINIAFDDLQLAYFSIELSARMDGTKGGFFSTPLSFQFPPFQPLDRTILIPRRIS